ncbi:MAG: LamG domain-containing protein [Cyclobacteriaceae bacterium]
MNKLFILIIAVLVLACDSSQEDLIEPQANFAPNPGGDREKPQNPIRPILDDCVIAYYPFTGNAADHSGLNNHGVVTGATLTGDRHGNSNQAYFFDGIDDVINVPYHPQLDLQGAFTLSAWISPGSIKTQMILTRGGSPNPSYKLSLTGTNEISFSAKAIGGVRAEGYEINEWYLLTAVYNNGVMTLYVNDKQVAQETYAPGTIDYSQISNLQIGRRISYNDSFFGKIDEVKIYCRALGSRDVYHLYHSTK